MVAPKSSRLLPPLQYLFRDAHRAGDARKAMDVRDEYGARVITGRRGMTRQPVSETVLRAEVSRNLSALLNTVHLEATQDLSAVPQARRSILNFGIDDLSSLTIDETRVNELTDTIRQAILKYEPRIVPETIEAERDTNTDDDLSVRFLVRADLTAEPINLPVEFVAEVERDSAKFRIERL